MIKLVDEISQSKSAEEAWFQQRSGARLFHNVMFVKRYLFELETLVGWKGAVGLKKRKMKFSFPFFFPPVAAADDVDQRKVTEGKMHIEKALGNIWCRRQSRLYHSSGEKTRCREIWMPPDTPMHVSHNVGILIKDANLSDKSTCLRCPTLNGVEHVNRVRSSSPRNTEQTTKETWWWGTLVSLFFLFSVLGWN